MDMVDYQSRLGYVPAKVRNEDYWYLSPLRDEKTASFKINRKIIMVWDRGNLIDFPPFITGNLLVIF